MRAWLAPIAAIAFLAVYSGAHAEIVDRIAASVGHEVITETQVQDQIRVTAFIDGATPDLSADNKRKVLERLIDQTLIRREVEFTRFQQPAPAEVEPLWKQIETRFSENGAKYGVTEKQVLAQLAWQLTLLRFIEYRFQPAVQVTNAEIRQEYRRQASAWREKNGTDAPPLDNIRADVEKIVRQNLTDSALDRWLGEVRTQNTILYREAYQ